MVEIKKITFNTLRSLSLKNPRSEGLDFLWGSNDVPTAGIFFFKRNSDPKKGSGRAMKENFDFDYYIPQIHPGWMIQIRYL